MSLCHALVAFTPTAIWPIIRHPSDLSQHSQKHPGLDCSYVLTTLHRTLYFHSTSWHSPDWFNSAFSCYAQYHNFWLQHLTAVWNLHLNVDFEKPTLISYKAFADFFSSSPFMSSAIQDTLCRLHPFKYFLLQIFVRFKMLEM